MAPLMVSSLMNPPQCPNPPHPHHQIELAKAYQAFVRHRHNLMSEIHGLCPRASQDNELYTAKEIYLSIYLTTDGLAKHTISCACCNALSDKSVPQCLRRCFSFFDGSSTKIYKSILITETAVETSLHIANVYASDSAVRW